MVTKILKISLTSIVALIVTACASSHVLVGKARPAISPEAVKVYGSPPAKYEQVAFLEASSKGSFALGDQGKMNKVIVRLKEEAAALGANGILLSGMGSESTGAVIMPIAGTGMFMAPSAMHKNGQGVAIFVTQE